jgi:hypothetical protein
MKYLIGFLCWAVIIPIVCIVVVTGFLMHAISAFLWEFKFNAAREVAILYYNDFIRLKPREDDMFKQEPIKITGDVTGCRLFDVVWSDKGSEGRIVKIEEGAIYVLPCYPEKPWEFEDINKVTVWQQCREENSHLTPKNSPK